MTDIVKKTLDEYIEEINKAEDDLELGAAEDRAYGAIDFAHDTRIINNKEYEEYFAKAANAVYETDKELQ